MARFPTTRWSVFTAARDDPAAARTALEHLCLAYRPVVVRADVPAPLPECPQLKMIRMEGEVYFGAVPHVADHLRDLRAAPDAPRHLLVMAKSMNFIDFPAVEMWRHELTARRGVGGDVYFHRPRPQVLALWARLGFVHELGADHVFAGKREAIGRIFQRLDPVICSCCSVRLYEECQGLPPLQPWLKRSMNSGP